MKTATAPAIANGLRTDHPVPGLPFVDDSILHLDNPREIEALGRTRGDSGMWGRTDKGPVSGSWRAFTTDPNHPHYAWIVRHHPEHGTAITLVKDTDGANVYTEQDDSWWLAQSPAIVTRAGGYWWDGTRWHRPLAFVDEVSDTLRPEIVADAETITVADLLGGHLNVLPDALPTSIDRLDDESGYASLRDWMQRALGAWAARRDDAARPYEQCIVSLHASELDSERLLGVAEFAAELGIGESTLRAYLSRGQVIASQEVRPPRWSEEVVRLEKQRRVTSQRRVAFPGERSLQYLERIRERLEARGDGVTTHHLVSALDRLAVMTENPRQVLACALYGDFRARRDAWTAKFVAPYALSPANARTLEFMAENMGDVAASAVQDFARMVIAGGDERTDAEQFLVEGDLDGLNERLRSFVVEALNEQRPSA